MCTVLWGREGRALYWGAVKDVRCIGVVKDVRRVLEVVNGVRLEL